MTRRFVISDHHFRHRRIWEFTDGAGERIRPWASSPEDGDAMLIEAHNEVVRQHDTVYFLGDVAMRPEGLKLLPSMNGRKILIRGNHDIYRLKQYLEHFKDIRATHKLGNVILSHYPLHPRSLPHWCLGNIHGHTHDRDVERRTWWGARRPDPRYFNASIESMGLQPLEIEEVVRRLQARRPNAKAAKKALSPENREAASS